MVVITGCTSGLGKALAYEYRAMGHTVIGCGRRRDRLDAMRDEFGAPHRFIECDIASEASVSDFARQCAEGDVDVVISNAGANNAPALPWNMESADWDKVVQVNLNGAFYITRHLGAVLHAQATREGAPLKRLINISSGVGHSTNHYQCAPRRGAPTVRASFVERVGVSATRARVCRRRRRARDVTARSRS